ncbi:unnamed protein product, partial [Candidula unifasciata]
MLASARARACLTCLFQLMGSVFVYSKLAPPCMSQLGLKYNGSHNSLVFHIAAWDDEADNVRLNSPQAWIPSNISDSFIEINISQPVLLTALQVQGDPEMTGLVTGWLLETSLDCDHYNVENYSIDSERLLDTETVLLRKMEFVTCIRLTPTQYTGQWPALRLELLGCAVYENSRCCQDVQPAKELWIDGGGCQVNYDHEVVFSWVKVLLELQTPSEDNVTISTSLTCEYWHYLDISDMNVISVTSDDKRSRWLTIELGTPIRARCLRIYPPPAAKLREVQTSDCGSRFTSSLVELDADSTDPGQKDVETTSVVTTNTTSRETPSVVLNFTTFTEISSVATTDITSRETINIASVSTTSRQTTTASPGTMPATPKTEASGEYLSTQNQNETTVPMEKYMLTNLDGNDNGSQANQTQSTNKPNNSDISTHSLLLESTTSANNIRTTDASVEKTTTEIIRGANISNENSLTDSSSPHGTASNDSEPANGTYINVYENTERNETVTESTSTHSMFSDHSTNNTITSTAEAQSPDAMSADEGINETLKSKENNRTECGMKTEAQGIRIKRVIGGHLNSPGQWPWLVSLHFLKEFEFTKKSGFKHTCGASLVAPGWVITAAHCFSDALLDGLSNLTIWRVYFGMHDLAKARSDAFVQERLIDSVFLYPSYNITEEPLLYDLALVRLNETVEINDRVSPICLDGHTDLHDEENICYVSGWGQTTMESPGSRYPYTAAMATMTLSKCREMYDRLPDDHEIKEYARIDSPVLCAAVGTDGQDACQ